MTKINFPQERERKRTTFFLAEPQQHGAEPSLTSPGMSLQVLPRTSKRAEISNNGLSRHEVARAV